MTKTREGAPPSTGIIASRQPKETGRKGSCAADRPSDQKKIVLWGRYHPRKATHRRLKNSAT